VKPSRVNPAVRPWAGLHQGGGDFSLVRPSWAARRKVPSRPLQSAGPQGRPVQQLGAWACIWPYPPGVWGCSPARQGGSVNALPANQQALGCWTVEKGTHWGGGQQTLPPALRVRVEWQL